MLYRCLLFLGTMFFASLSVAESMNISLGTMTTSLSMENLKKSYKTHSVRIVEFHLGKQVTYQAIDLVEVLDRALGKKWRKEDNILFLTADGYKSNIPVEKVIRYQPYLAYAIVGSSNFVFTKRIDAGDDCELGPFYLIWDNLKYPVLQETKSSDFPYQVTGITFVNFDTLYSKVLPPKKASASAQAGFQLFRSHCLTCHTINGQGGSKACDLNYPMNVTEYFDKDILHKWIADPQSIRWNSSMSAYKNILKNPSQDILDIIEYLKVMKDHKKAP